jgi:hypothetical protein
VYRPLPAYVDLIPSLQQIVLPERSLADTGLPACADISVGHADAKTTAKPKREMFEVICFVRLLRLQCEWSRPNPHRDHRRPYFGFHSRAIFCASASWLGVILEAMKSRIFGVAGSFDWGAAKLWTQAPASARMQNRLRLRTGRVDFEPSPLRRPPPDGLLR